MKSNLLSVTQGGTTRGRRVEWTGLLGGIWVGLSAFAGTVFGAAPVIPETVIRVLKQRVDYGYNAGVAVGVINGDGRTFFGYGRKSLETEATPDEDTVFEIGSVTKVFTSILLADSVARGEVELGDSVAALLPLGPAIPSSTVPMTLLDLATHRSGLPVNPTNFCVEDTTRPFECYTEERWETFLGSYVLPREPGALWEYSNAGVGLLGYVLATRSGKPYEALLRERVLAPMGLASTGIEPAAQEKDRWATGYSAGLRRAPFRMPVLEGAGALRSTVSDLLDFLAFNLGFRETALKPVLETVRQRRFATPSEGLSMGLGWFLWDLPGGRVVQHGGETPGFTAFVAYHPARRLGVVILSNARVSAYSAINDVGFHLLDSAYPLTSIRRPAEVSDQTLVGYMGIYEEPGGDAFEVGRVGRLLVGYHVRSNFEFVLVPESIRRFGVYEIEVGPNVAAQFRVDAAGRVTGMDWTQGGQTVAYGRRGDPAALRIVAESDGMGLSIEGGGRVAYDIEESHDLREWRRVGRVGWPRDNLRLTADRLGRRAYRALRLRTPPGQGLLGGVRFPVYHPFPTGLLPSTTFPGLAPVSLHSDGMSTVGAADKFP